MAQLLDRKLEPLLYCSINVDKVIASVDVRDIAVVSIVVAFLSDKAICGQDW